MPVGTTLLSVAGEEGAQGEGLAFMNTPSGSLIAYSTAPGKTALDGGSQNSPYTTALLENIGTPNITVLEMFQGVRSTVISKSDGKQSHQIVIWRLQIGPKSECLFIRQGWYGPRIRFNLWRGW